MLLGLIVSWSLVGALAGALVGLIAQSKGRGSGGWGICGFVIFPTAPADDRAAQPPGPAEVQQALLARAPPPRAALIQEIRFDRYPSADRSSGSSLDMKC
ncbi:hypothetical protein LJR225_004457 [Phenylobacterium sp. LjRoot225]|uniref:hypothetical protein n=1 Tax=Phenylobacterium sp. LjRoot225 TaxID=3342285 RepID=UPI003ECD4615